MSNKLKVMIAALPLTLFLFSCNQMEQFSPEKVITKALAVEDGLTYYGEAEMVMNELEELDGAVVKEWRKNEKSRSEIEADGQSIISVMDGKSMTFYEVEEKTALILEDDSLAEFQMNPKEQVEMILDAVRDTHDIETVGEDTVAGRTVIHLVAKKKKGEKSLFGDQEFWVDKENWMVLKMKATTGDSQNIVQYTKIDFNAKVDDSIFQLDLPEDVVIKTMDDFESMEEEIDLKNIPNKMNSDVLYIPDSEEHRVGTITYLEIEDEPTYSDVTIDYKKADGFPLMTLTIQELENEADDEMDDFGDFAEQVTIRDEKGVYVEFDDFRSVSWNEDGLSYSIDLINQKLTMEDVIEYTETMEVMK